MRHKETQYIVMCAVFISLGVLLPFIFHFFPSIGSIILPMHIPVLLCGFVCGKKYGTICGAVTPILSALILSRPTLFPNAVAMMFELAAYGFFAGLTSRHMHFALALVISMVCGRFVLGIVSFPLYSFAGINFGIKIFLMSAFVTCWPGILIQLMLIPTILISLQKAKVIEVLSHNNREAKISLQVVALENGIEDCAAIKEYVLIAIDGQCCGGKSTLAKFLSDKYHANCFHLDDFYLKESSRKALSKNKGFANADIDRFRVEVLEKLRSEEPFFYKKYDVKNNKFIKVEVETQTKINIIEGSFCTADEIRNHYDIKVFVTINEKERLKRLKKRESNFQVFIDKWIKLEENFFDKENTKDRADIVVKIG